MEEPAPGLSQQVGEAEGSLTLEAQSRAGAALTTTRQAGTARQPGLGKRDGKVYERRNQWWNLRKCRTGPKPGGQGSVSGARRRSEEHTSELQSQSNLVCRLLLEKKKKENHD